MAHLPGERPLVNPWEFESGPLETSVTSWDKSLDIIRGISGPGSVYLEYGHGVPQVKLIAIVRGPRQQSVSRPQFDVDVSFASLSGSDSTEITRTLAAFAREAIEGSLDLDAHPNSAISLSIKIVESSPNLALLSSACITAGSVALKDAGIVMNDMVVSVPVDSTVGSENSSCIAMLIKSKKICFINMSGISATASEIDTIVHMGQSLIEDVVDRLGLSEIE